MRASLTIRSIFIRWLLTLMTAFTASLGTTAFATTESHQAKFRPAPLVSIPTHDQFFEAIRAHCGKAYAGKIAVDNAPGDAFTNKGLVMFVRLCTDSELQIPLPTDSPALNASLSAFKGGGEGKAELLLLSI